MLLGLYYLPREQWTEPIWAFKTILTVRSRFTLVALPMTEHDVRDRYGDEIAERMPSLGSSEGILACTSCSCWK